MNEIKVLHSRDVHFALKRNGGRNAIKELMERFGFSTREELFDAIRKVSPSGSNELIRELEKKEKSSTRKKPRNASAVEIRKEETQIPEPEELPTEETHEQETEELPTAETTEIVVEENVAGNVQKTPEKAHLKAQEQELSQMLCGIEVKWQEEVSTRAAILKDVAKAQKAADELTRLLKAQRGNVMTLLEHFEGCNERMRELNKEKKVCRALLDEVRAQISELEKVTILVYQNGTIEVENGDAFLVSDEEITETLIMLVSMPQVGKITIDELKAIAKLLKMVKVYETNGTPFELEFDSMEVQRLWETVTIA